MTNLRSIAVGLAALALAGAVGAQSRPVQAGGAKRAASHVAPPVPVADESDPTLPKRGSAEDCRAWRAEYAKSQACFAPYRNATGGIKAEAFRACGPEVLDPSAECGVPRAR